MLFMDVLISAWLQIQHFSCTRRCKRSFFSLYFQEKFSEGIPRMYLNASIDTSLTYLWSNLKFLR